jgi:hypothetical protein
VEIDAALAAELAVLTEALDDPGADIAENLLRLATDARAAVASYRGLMVLIPGADPPIAFTAFDDGAKTGDIRTSLMLASATVNDDSLPRVSLVLFAAVPGAFVDLAADLTWMAGQPLTSVVLDQHLPVRVDDHDHAGDTLQKASVINQALGVLIGRGCTPEQADLELAARAAEAGTDRHRAAVQLLDSIRDVEPDPRAELPQSQETDARAQPRLPYRSV